MTPIAPTANEGVVRRAVREILEEFLGSTLPNGLIDTPLRVYKMYSEMLSGYHMDPATILKSNFNDDEEVAEYSGIVLVKNIEFYSLCEHHICPFHGLAHIGYIPNPPEAGGRVVGLSKLARLLEVYTKRLQMQERITMQVANALEEHVHPLGAMVMLTNVTHTCLSMRGVKAHGAMTDTSEVRGVFATKEASRAEFMRLVLGPR